MKKGVNKFWKGTKMLVSSISEDNVMSYSSSIAFYTLFSLPAMILVVLFTTNLFTGPNSVNGQFYAQIGDLIGEDAGKQLQESIGNVSMQGKSWFNAIVGVCTLIFAATTLFATLQAGLNFIWGVKSKPKNGIIGMVFTRLLSFAMVLMLGFIMLASLLLDAIFASVGDFIHESFPNFSSFYAAIMNNAISLICITLLFGAMFKVLPDAKVKWKNIWTGAIVTAVLFIIGKYAIGLYLGKSSVSSSYGAAGALVVILLWVYYLVTIILIGAVFTKVYTIMNDDQILPTRNSVKIKVTEIQTDDEGEKEKVVVKKTCG